jgi:MFS transporter, DHA1 family, tetracycline resistance protein
MNIKLLPIYLLHFINFFNLMLWGPILEPILKQQKVVDPRMVLIFNGLIIASYPLSQFFAIHPLNSLSDKIGKRKVLLLTQIGTAISILLSIIAISIPQLRIIGPIGVSYGLMILILSRILDGITGGNAMVTNNYANDIINKEKLDSAESFSSIELSMIGGSLMGVFMGPIFASTRFGSVGALYLVFVIAILGIYVTYKKVIDIKKSNDNKIKLSNDFNIWHQIIKIRGYPIVQNTLMYRIVFQFIFMSFITNIFIFLNTHLNIEGSETSIVMLIISLITIFVIMNIVPFLTKRFGNIKAFEYSKYFLLFGLLLFYIFPFFGTEMNVGVLLLIAFFILVIGVATALSLFKHFLTSTVEVEKQGHMIALEEQFIILSSFLGATLSGFVIALFKELNWPSQTLFLYFFILGCIYVVFDKYIYKLIRRKL